MHAQESSTPSETKQTSGEKEDIRRLLRSSDPNASTESSWSVGHTLKEIKSLQENDINIGPILKWKISDDRPRGNIVTSSAPKTRHYWNYWNSLELHDGLLFKRTHENYGKPSHIQLIVPRAMREKILHQMHNSLLAGHLGHRKTTNRILQRFYWYELRTDVYNWVRKCDNCGSNKPPVKTPRAPMGDMRAGAAMDRWATDILGPLPLTPRENRYVLVVTDAFSKWTEAFAIPDQTAKTCARTILNEMISRFGCPLEILSDLGRNYESDIFKELCAMLNVRKIRTSIRRPQTNGIVERFNKTLIRMIRAFLKDEQSDWDLHLGCITSAYRSTPHETTRYTPNMLMLGREIRLPSEVTVRTPNNHETLESYGSYVTSLRSKIAKAHEITREHLKTGMQRQKEHYDTKCTGHKYSPGDIVWYLSEMRTEGSCPKLQPQFSGPYIILKCYNNIDFCIQVTKEGKQRVIHFNKLKPYVGNLQIPWINKIRKRMLKS